MIPVRVAIVEDNSNLRQSLFYLVDSTEGYSCTGAYKDCNNLIEQLKDHVADVVLMDIDLPGISGIEGVALIRAHYPNVHVVMQTVFDDEDKIFAAICAGASGYILKGVSPSRILESVREVMDGGSPMSPSIARKVMGLVNKRPVEKATEISIHLTEREKEVLEHLVSGKSYKMIAAACNVSITTINTHIRHIYEKLQVNSVQEAVSTAIRKGLV